MVAVEVLPLPMGTWGAFQFTFLLVCVHLCNSLMLCQKNVTDGCNCRSVITTCHIALWGKKNAPLLTCVFRMCLETRGKVFGRPCYHTAPL